MDQFVRKLMCARDQFKRESGPSPTAIHDLDYHLRYEQRGDVKKFVVKSKKLSLAVPLPKGTAVDVDVVATMPSKKSKTPRGSTTKEREIPDPDTKYDPRFCFTLLTLSGRGRERCVHLVEDDSSISNEKEFCVDRRKEGILQQGLQRRPSAHLQWEREVHDTLVRRDDSEANRNEELEVQANILSVLDPTDTFLLQGVGDDEKCQWLRSQIIGNSQSFESPFGSRIVSYADHTASGRGLLFVETCIVNNLLPVYGNSHTEDSFVGRTTSQFVNEASSYVKRCMGGKDEDVLIFCGSGSTAAIKRLQDVMAISVPSILRESMMSTLSREQRWVVFVGPYEHHSNILSWRNSLAEVVEVPLSKEGLVDIQKLQEELQDPKYEGRPKLGSFSAASNVTGLLTDTRSIARILHAHQSFACFDFAGCGPYVPIDMRSGETDGYDAIFVSPHKFMGGPGTPGLLMMRKQLYRLGSHPPSTCGGGPVEYANGLDEKDTIYAHNIEHREDSGTPPIIQKVKTALVFLVKELIGTELIMERESYFIRNAISRLKGNQNIMILGNTEASRIAILSFNIYSSELDMLPQSPGKFGGFGPDYKRTTRRGKFLHHRFVVTLLNDLFGIQARGGCSCAAPYAHTLLSVSSGDSLRIRELVTQGYRGVKPGWARVSFGYYITTEEYEFILAAIEFIADRGQRFLPLYEFGWNTGNWTFRESRRDLINNPETLYLERKVRSSLNRSTSWVSNCRVHEFGGGKSMSDAERNTTFHKYLHIATDIADCLPVYPARQCLPFNIDPSLVSFTT